MSTAHRPTWVPAQGGKSTLGGVHTWGLSAKDQLGQTKLKFRQVGQSSQQELRYKDYKNDLDDKELTQVQEILKAEPGYLLTAELTIKEEKNVDIPRLLMNKPDISNENLKKYDDSDADLDTNDSDKDLESSDDEDDSDDDDEDDELELQRELERIKAERAQALIKKEEEEKIEEEKLKRDSALKGNPLMNFNNGDDNSSKIKRRWNDDVVFRNQTRSEPEIKKRFINDTIRNDFHRNFLKRFMK
jgi:protein CWC15